VRAERFAENPIIRPHMDTRMGDNINGPSLVRAPTWVDNPLGKYYLYFGNHRGKYIRLAYADRLEGPWKTHEPGVLDLGDAFFVKHIASPEVHVDENRREVRLYYHGPLAEADKHGPHGRHSQATRVALSQDGLHFEAQPEVLGSSYMRLFQWGGWWYAIAMPGIFYRSRDGLTNFEEGHNLFSHIAPGMRHAAFLREGETLHVFYSNRGDCPERLLMSSVNLTRDWSEWRPSEPVAVLEPELDYEGVNEPLVPSSGGPIDGPARQLRDPAIFEEDGRTYLLYSVAGEQGIAIARLSD
jgi:hypothetical protein